MIKVLFDENFGQPLIKPLAELLARSPSPLQPADLRHILEFYAQGTPDSVWIPQIAAEGWILISADRSRRSGGPKLPLLCREYQLTHILLTGTIHHQPQYQKIQSVLAVWQDIVAAAQAPKGTQYLLKLTGTKRPRPILTLKKPT